MRSIDYYLIALLLVSAGFVIFWVHFAYYRYANFISGYYDAGVSEYNFYWHANGLQYYTNPLQFLVFTNHISFFVLLLLPIYALFQNPMTMFLMQDVTLALTAIVVYFVTDSILKSRRLGFAFAIAFLVNPAVIGLASNDFHLQSFLAIFYILAFYFYVKRRAGCFALSFVLLLSIQEVTPMVAGSLLAGLLLYEKFYEKGREDAERKKMMALGLCATVASFLIYYALLVYIPSTYAGGSQPSVVPIQRLVNFAGGQISALIQSNSSVRAAGPIATLFGEIDTAQQFDALLAAGLFIGLVAFFFGFGLTSLEIPLVSIVLYFPWWFEVAIVQNASFTYPFFQYYAFALGGSVVSAVLGIMHLETGRKGLAGRKNRDNEMLKTLIAGSALLISLALSAGFVNSLYLGEKLFSYPQYQFAQTANRAIGLIPQNSNVMAESGIAPHLFKIRNLELSPLETPYIFKQTVQVYWFKPDYVIYGDYYVQSAYFLAGPPFNESNFSSDYSLIFNQNGTYIYKRNGAA